MSETIRAVRRAFWFHYNKPASARAGSPRLTVHYKGQCHVVRGVECMVPVHSRLRKSQPHVVMAGVGRLEVEYGYAYLT